jgi:hypothetical protein
MNGVLLALTIVSLVATVGFAYLTWRTIAADRERSAARVASLASAIDHGGLRPGMANEPVAVGTMFTTTPGGSLKSHPLVKAAVVGTMAIAIVVAVAMSSGSVEGQARPGATPVSARQNAPLELVSMRHARDGNTLTVAGLVRNPRGGGAAARITAVVFAFDRSGTFVASGRAPLDFTTLEPGDESPFVVTIPNVTDVGRYRVSFRTDAGMLRHVDRRSDQLRLAAAGRP